MKNSAPRLFKNVKDAGAFFVQSYKHAIIVTMQKLKERIPLHFLWLYGKIINSFQPYTFIAPIFFNSKNILEVNKSTAGLPK